MPPTLLFPQFSTWISNDPGAPTGTSKEGTRIPTCTPALARPATQRTCNIPRARSTNAAIATSISSSAPYLAATIADATPITPAATPRGVTTTYLLPW
jgi:hypothetical protein